MKVLIITVLICCAILAYGEEEWQPKTISNHFPAKRGIFSGRSARQYDMGWEESENVQDCSHIKKEGISKAIWFSRVHKCLIEMKTRQSIKDYLDEHQDETEN